MNDRLEKLVVCVIGLMVIVVAWVDVMMLVLFLGVSNGS
jgi:hypothetical protein